MFPYPGAPYPPAQQTWTTTTYATGPATSTAVTTTTYWYSSYYSMVPPPEIVQLQAWFASMDTDRNGTITANELANVVFFDRPLGILGAIKMMQAFDKDRNGCLDFTEFVILHAFVKQMAGAFIAGDRDRSGYLDPAEILTALAVGGFNFPLPVVQELVKKFGKTRPMQVSFAEWILLCAHVAYLRSVFQWNDPANTGRVVLSFDQLVHVATGM